jgi:hypothetical protein
MYTFFGGLKLLFIVVCNSTTEGYSHIRGYTAGNTHTYYVTCTVQRNVSVYKQLKFNGIHVTCGPVIL